MEGRENKEGVITKDGDMGEPALSRQTASAQGTRNVLFSHPESTPADPQLHPRPETRRPKGGQKT